MQSRLLRLLICLALLTPAAQGQSSLGGVIDIDAHTDPDSLPRSVDSIDLARLAKQRGMSGIVLKNHYEPTTAQAYLARKEVPGIEVFGGIDLNRSVGGINPEAIEHMVQMTVGWVASFGFQPLNLKTQCVRQRRTGRSFCCEKRPAAPGGITGYCPGRETQFSRNATVGAGL